jgi:hypothetical protein
MQVKVPQDAAVLAYFSWLLEQPDYVLLDVTSTSPLYEKPDFPRIMRETAKWALKRAHQGCTGSSGTTCYAWKNEQWVRSEQ